ncbi:MAG: DUF374 domain-containing protein [Deltaproteobacteria bacterium]|nr:DUF374 domain-containing protein [Deltaproteobacteria bacterium]
MKIRLHHAGLQRLVHGLALKLVRGWMGTCRIHMAPVQASKGMLESPQPLLFSLWHCHLLAPLFGYRQHYSRFAPMAIMVSPSRDGELIGGVCRDLGFATCSGSRHKGGVAALQVLGDYLRQGYRISLVADGSRGPARVVQKGALFLARQEQAPILPVATAASRTFTFNTWDRFEIPLPFSRVAILFDEPFWVPAQARGAALEALRRDLQDRLHRLSERSRTYFSR